MVGWTDPEGTRPLFTLSKSVQRDRATSTSLFVPFRGEQEFPKSTFWTDNRLTTAKVIILSKFIDVCSAVPEVLGQLLKSVVKHAGRYRSHT